MLRSFLQAVGHVLFIAALVIIAAFFFLGFLGQMQDDYTRPERHSGAVGGGPP